MVRDVLTSKEVDGEVLTDNQREGISSRSECDGSRQPRQRVLEPGPSRQGFRFARRITTHTEGETPVNGFEPKRSSTNGMTQSSEERRAGQREKEAERRTLGE